MIHVEIRKSVFRGDDEYSKEHFYKKEKSKIILQFEKKAFFSPEIPNLMLIVRHTLVIVEGNLTR